MNYIKIYYDIINNAKLRGLDKKKLDGYFEKHHIIPKCYFKSTKIASYKENLVLLTAREHYICHCLLWKSNKSDNRMMLAMYRIINGNKIKYTSLTSKEYEALKLFYSNYIKISRTGEKNPNFGKKFSIETKKKMCDNHADFNGKNNPMFGVSRPGKDAPNYGKTHNDETKQRMRNIKIGNSYAKKPCVIDGMQYDSVNSAIIDKKISKPTIILRLKSENYENYYYI